MTRLMSAMLVAGVFSTGAVAHAEGPRDTQTGLATAQVSDDSDSTPVASAPPTAQQPSPRDPHSGIPVGKRSVQKKAATGSRQKPVGK